MSDNQQGNGYWRGYKYKDIMNTTQIETVIDVLKYPIEQWGLITEATMRRFGCRVKKNPITKEIDAVYFPAWDKKGAKIIGFQKKDLTIPKEEAYHFTNIGTVKVVGQMYGQKQAKETGKTLWVTEGWKDLMYAYQAMKESIKNKPYKDMEPCVCSVVGGCSNAAKSVAHNEEFVKSFERVVICMDPDYRKEMEPLNVIRGKEAEDEIGSYLSMSNIFVPNYPDQRDIGELFEEEGYAFVNDLIVWNIKPFQAEKILTFNEVMSFEESINPVEKGFMFDNFPLLNEKLSGERLNELTTYTGLPGSGKSSIAFEHIFQEALSGEKVGLIMLEDPIIKTQRRVAARFLKVHPGKYFLNPKSCASYEDLKKAWEFSIDPNKFMVLSHFGSIAHKPLMSKIKSLYASGCTRILFDHASMAISGLHTNDERKELDILYTELAAFRAAHNVHIKVICHVDKKAGTQDTTRPTEPKWNYINAANLRGCVDCDTEYLGEYGWKKISEYSGEKIFQYNTDGSIELTNIIRYISDECDFLYHFKNSTYTDMMLSPNHRVICVDERWPDKIKEVTAQEMLDKHLNLKMGFRGLIPCTFSKRIGNELLTEDLLRLQVAFNADGWQTNYSQMGRVRFTKQRKIQRFLKLIEKSGIKFSWWVNIDSSVEFSFIPPLKKGYTYEWYNLDQKSLNIVCDEVRHWDCDHNDGRFSSVNKEDSDFIQFVYACCGYRSLQRTIMNSGILPDGYGGYRKTNNQKLLNVVYKSESSKFTTWGKTKNNKSTWDRVVPKDGKQYCFTVPSGMFIARRNGRIFVTGNSAGVFQLSCNVILIHTEVTPDGSRGRVMVGLGKNRLGAKLGDCDIIKMGVDGCFYDASDEVWLPKIQSHAY